MTFESQETAFDLHEATLIHDDTTDTQISITAEEFSLEVENRVWADKDDDSYIHHTAKYIEELELELDDAKHLISKSLMDKITHEAMTNKLLKTRITTTSLFSF